VTAVETTAPDWIEANQRHLSLALARMKSILKARVRAASAPDESLEAEPDELESAPDGVTTALDRICELFRLSSFERDVLVLCAGVELDAAFAALCAEAQADPHRPFPTFSLALAALPDPHWSAVTPSSPLRRWRLVELGAGTAITTAPLRIDERILHFLTGIDMPDERLSGMIRGVVPPRELSPSHTAVARRIVEVWSAGSVGAPPPVIRLCGDGPPDREAVTAVACGMAGLTLKLLGADAIPAPAHEVESLARLWQREAGLSRQAILVECGDADPKEGTKGASVAAFVEQCGGFVIVGARDRWPTGRRRPLTLEVRKPTASEQRDAWRDALGPAAESLNGQVEQLAAHFDLGRHAIEAASLEALGQRGDELTHTIWEACRGQARPRLDDLAQRIDSCAEWDDLVLPEAQKQLLRDLAAHVRNRATVYERWGFAGRGTRGLGISALFAGASGTGKTMAAEVLASSLRLDLYRIDLSAVVSKYIGETEKNLRRIFDAAEEGGAVLLFDEADALFGKRSEVRDSHDRYANIEVSYLLQRMECYRGLAILTTNMKSAVDAAFLRRIRFVVQFPWPDAEQRSEIWRRVFPPATPTEGLDLHELAQLNIAGGSIRNIALHAAFLAADVGEAVRMEHLLRAARTEYAKLEKPLTEAEIEGWVG
jgi:hypothetical protein